MRWTPDEDVVDGAALLGVMCARRTVNQGLPQMRWCAPRRRRGRRRRANKRRHRSVSTDRGVKFQKTQEHVGARRSTKRQEEARKDMKRQVLKNQGDS